jgi:hypothetical protein
MFERWTGGGNFALGLLVHLVAKDREVVSAHLIRYLYSGG